MFRSGAPFMIVVLIAGLLLMRESRLELIGGLDESFADFLSRNSYRKEKPAPLTLVEIDEANLEQHPWPWTPLDFALFFQAANIFNPQVFVTDEVLQWDERKDAGEQRPKLPQYKKILREHILRAPKVLLGAKLGFPEDPDVIPPLQEVPVLRKVSGKLDQIPEFTAIDAQAEEGFRLSSVIGFTNLAGVERAYHSVPLLLRYRGQVVPSFVLQAMLLWEKLTPDDVQVMAGEVLKLGDQIEIPIDARGRMRVDFGVPRGRCNFEDLVLASAQVEAQRAPAVSTDLFAGKLLFLARTDDAASTLPLAAGRRGSPGELLSAAIATIQSRSFLKRAPFWFDCLLLLAMIVLSGWIPRLKRGVTFLAAGVFIVVYVLIAIAVLGQTLTWLPIILPGGLAVFIAIFRSVLPHAE